jgi:LacI family transcriptional regulator
MGASTFLPTWEELGRQNQGNWPLSLLALGCYDAIEERDLSCPGDISVTGFNDMPFVDRLSPPLTSLHIQHDELGVQAANLLLAEIRDHDAPKSTIRLDPELVVRGSTAPQG